MIEPEFPAPVILGKRPRWALSGVMNWERVSAGLPPLASAPADEKWLTSSQVCERLNVSQMWLWRRTAGAARSRAAAG